MNSERHLVELFHERFSAPPASVEALRADGSNRRIWRLRGGDGASVVGFFGPDALENRAFVSFTSSFRSIGLPVPEIVAERLDQGVYLEEDLGDLTLLKATEAARTGDEFPRSIVPTYRRVLELLARFQVEGGRVVDYADAHPVAEFDRRGIMWDLNYFKYEYLKLADIPFHESRLEADFERLTDFLLEADRSHFLYRDFQPRNVMLRDGEPWFIDYQGGRRGALQYDVASLLYSSKASIPEALRAELLESYLDALERLIPVDRARFREHYRGFVLVRILQLLGAYGYRGYYERKPHFLESVPHAVRNIRTLLDGGSLPVELPELRDVLATIAERHVANDERRTTNGEKDRNDERRTTNDEKDRDDERRTSNGKKDRNDERRTSNDDITTNEKQGRSTGGEIDTDRASSTNTSPRPHVPMSPLLTVHVRSFSYKRGYPEETSGHGGGFVFDCRWLHNPGRYDDYKPLCGMDEPVVTFLEKEEPVGMFWESIWRVVSEAVRAYLARGFEHLSVGFGCTGGQHRSVYFAERLARSLRTEFPEIAVEVSHRESQHWPGSSTASAAASPINPTGAP